MWLVITTIETNLQLSSIQCMTEDKKIEKANTN